MRREAKRLLGESQAVPQRLRRAASASLFPGRKRCAQVARFRTPEPYSKPLSRALGQACRALTLTYTRVWYRHQATAGPGQHCRGVRDQRIPAAEPSTLRVGKRERRTWVFSRAGISPGGELFADHG